MNYQQVRKAQRKMGNATMQAMIDNGSVWKLEGSIGRVAMRMLETGACMLPLRPQMDAYGNLVPSRRMLKKGTKGTFQNSVKFYSICNR